MNQNMESAIVEMSRSVARSGESGDVHHGSRRIFRMTREIYESIEQTIGNQQAERGGVLGGSREDELVSSYYYDDHGDTSRATYSPDHEQINRLFREKWNPNDIDLLGFVHSHPGRFGRPSGGDRAYAREILARNPHLNRLLLPLVRTVPDTGSFEIVPFAAVLNGNFVNIVELNLEIVDAVVTSDIDKGAELVPVESELVELVPETVDNTFVRVAGAYDLTLLSHARLVCCGVGGGRGFVEDQARAGVGQFVLIDPDTVSITNIATQHVWRSEIGRPKVDVLAERIRDINPNAFVVARQQRIEDIYDAEMEMLATWGPEGSQPGATLLLGMTDDFFAQSRVNRLALHLGLQSLCAQMYAEGKGAEITFTHPETTPACQRCATRRRYEAYLHEGFQNTVTSDGTPIFSTSRLNSLKSVIAMALLHHGTDHPRWGGLLERIGNRNLILIRMDPDLDLPQFDQAFGGGDQRKILFDEPIFLAQDPDCPKNGFTTCPECGGTGNLLDVKGTFTDTREMIPYPESD